MAKIYVGNTGYKLSLGNNKIKKGYLGNILVYSGDVGVTYHIDDTSGLQYNEVVEEGYDCLSPRSFNPAGLKPGYTFLGWRSDTTPSSSVYNVLIAGSEPIDLYAVYYIDYTINYYNGSTSVTSKSYRAYYNNGNNSLPSTKSGDLSMNTVSGFENAIGWTNVLGSYTQIYNNNGKITGINSNMNLYSIYSKNVSVIVINGSSSGAVQSTVSGVINKQFGSTVSTKYPDVNLTHNYISGWTNAGWNMNINSSEKLFDDGRIEITESFNGKTIYALYTLQSTVTVVNGSDNGPVRTNEHGFVSRIYVPTSVASVGYKDFKFTVRLTHNSVSGFSSAGWSTTLGDYVSRYSDGEVNVDLSSVTLYALYSKSVKVTVFNGYNYPDDGTAEYSAVKTPNNLTRYRQYNTTTYTEKDPTLTLSHASVTGWSNAGWNLTKSNKDATLIDGTINVNSDYDGKSIYALYKKKVSLIYYNGVVIGNTYTPDKRTVTDYSIAQFNTSYYRYSPKVTLAHTSVTGWTNNGWSISTNPGTKFKNDGDFTISKTYDGATLYALYYKPISIVIYNASSGATSKTDVTKNVVLEYRNDYKRYNPTISLTHGTHTGWNSNGWAWTTDSDSTNTYTDGTFTITEDMNGKSLGAGYKRAVTVRWYNDPSNVNSYTDESKWHYIRACSQYPPYFSETIPTFKRKITDRTDWRTFGWQNYAPGSTKYCNDNQAFYKDSYGDNPLILYAGYYRAVTLTQVSKGQSTTRVTNAYCASGKSGNEKASFDILPVSQDGRTFLGWSTNTTKDKIISDTYFRYGIISDTTLYAIWKIDDRVLINNPSGNNYECPFVTGNPRFVTYHIGTTSYSDYECVSELDITTRITPGEWHVGTWSYQRFYPGTVPVNYIEQGSDVNGSQPPSKYLRGVNWQHSSGRIETDEGPCANNVRTTLTNIPLYETNSTNHTSNIYIAFLGDMAAGSITIYKLTLKGRTVAW